MGDWITKTPKDFSVDILRYNHWSPPQYQKAVGEIYDGSFPGIGAFWDENKPNYADDFGGLNLNYDQIHMVNIPAPASIFLVAMLVFYKRLKREPRCLNTQSRK